MIRVVDGRHRAARAAAARRGELGMTQQELAGAAGVDTKTIWSLETGGRWPIARTRARIEKALSWPQGELDRIASDSGGSNPGLPPLQPQDDWERAILDSPRLPDDEKRRMIERSRAVRNEMFPLPAAGGAGNHGSRGAAAS